MGAALGLMLLAEAATACAPAPRFAGRAVIVRPVANAEPVPLKHLGPATGIQKDKTVEQTGAELPSQRHESHQPAKRCEALTHIV